MSASRRLPLTPVSPFDDGITSTLREPDEPLSDDSGLVLIWIVSTRVRPHQKTFGPHGVTLPSARREMSRQDDRRGMHGSFLLRP
jgi:hypothetical protein